MIEKIVLFNDEPVCIDSLGRGQLINALKCSILGCEPPFTIAVDGGWGTGKTSILKCLEETFKSINIRSVWFSPWKFQFEESPAVSLLQEIRETAIRKNWISLDRKKKEALKLLNIVSTLAGEIVLKTVTGGAVSTKDIINQGSAFEEKYFEAKQLTTRMQDAFHDAIIELLGSNGSNNEHKLIFFIDDLDRCRTDIALRLLESLKLFLNAKNCVYVFAIDLDHLALCLENDYTMHKPWNYLQKIFQLIYRLPPPEFTQIQNLVQEKLKEKNDSKEDWENIFGQEILNRIKYDLSYLLGDNPRSLKQFCNRFLLERGILREALSTAYNPVIHIFLQIIQECFPTAFELFRRHNSAIIINENGKTPFDLLIKKWIEIIKGAFEQSENPINQSPSCIRQKPFYDFLKLMPSHLRKRRTNGYKFVTAKFIDSDIEIGILCIEDHPKNKRINEFDCLSDLSDLSNTLLAGLNLSHTRLDRCNFEGADLSGTDISFSDCTLSKLNNVRFDHGYANKTIFDEAELKGLTYQGAQFLDTRIEKVKNIDDDLKEAIVIQKSQKGDQ